MIRIFGRAEPSDEHFLDHGIDVRKLLAARPEQYCVFNIAPDGFSAVFCHDAADAAGHVIALCRHGLPDSEMEAPQAVREVLEHHAISGCH